MHCSSNAKHERDVLPYHPKPQPISPHTWWKLKWNKPQGSHPYISLTKHNSRHTHPLDRSKTMARLPLLLLLLVAPVVVAFQQRAPMKMMWQIPGPLVKKAAPAPAPPVNEPRPFFIRADQFLEVATAGAVALLRGGNGAFVQGYKVAFVDTDQIEAGEFMVLGV